MTHNERRWSGLMNHVLHYVDCWDLCGGYLGTTKIHNRKNASQPDALVCDLLE